MKRFKGYSALELEQFEKVKKIGEYHGSSPQLKSACQEAYRLYRAGKISAECYGNIYSEAFDNYLAHF